MVLPSEGGRSVPSRRRIEAEDAAMGLFSKKSTQIIVAEEFDPAPQSTAPVQLAAPAFDDPDDVTRWEMVHSANSLLAAMMAKYQECFEKAELMERAYAMGDAEFVNGVRQHEISRKNFHDRGVQLERELDELLLELRASTSAAREQWQNLVFLLPGSDNGVMKIGAWCISHGVDSEVMSSLIGNGVFINTDFGATRQSFWTENDRILAVLNQPGQ